MTHRCEEVESTIARVHVCGGGRSRVRARGIDGGIFQGWKNFGDSVDSVCAGAHQSRRRYAAPQRTKRSHHSFSSRLWRDSLSAYSGKRMRPFFSFLQPAAEQPARVLRRAQMSRICTSTGPHVTFLTRSPLLLVCFVFWQVRDVSS